LSSIELNFALVEGRNFKSVPANMNIPLANVSHELIREATLQIPAVDGIMNSIGKIGARRKGETATIVRTPGTAPSFCPKARVQSVIFRERSLHGFV